MAKPKTSAVAVSTAPNALDLINQPPDFLKKLEGNGASATYVQFAHPAAKNYSAIIAAKGGKNIRKSQPVLVTPEELTILNPSFDFIVLPSYFQYYAISDGEGKPTKTGETKFSENGEYATEFVDAAILVVFEGEMTPATCRFRGPKCQGIKKAVDMLETVQTEEWLKQSKEHGLAAKSKLPSWAWFVNVSQLETKPTKNPKGQPYEVLTTSDRPTTALELKQLMDLSKDADWTAKVSAVLESIKSRKSEVEALMS